MMPTTPRSAFYEMDYIRGATPTAYKGSDSDVELDLDIIDSGTYTRFQTVGGANPTAGAVNVTAGGVLKDGASTDMELFKNTATNELTEISSTLEIMELRRTQALTRFLEAENRLGTDNYGDWLLSVFGVTNPDFRANKPVYLGGGKLRTNVNSIQNPGDVLKPSDDSVEIPAGYQAGLAGIQGSTSGVNLNVTEYGIVMNIMSVIPRTTYANKIDRFWTKYANREEFYNPYFQGIGDQEIYNCEVGFELDGATNLDTWGYQNRNAEYKYKLNEVQNEFVSDSGAGGLDAFHMAKVHDITGPVMTLTEANLTVDYTADENLRIFQSQGSEHHLYYTVYNDCQMVRPMYLTDIPV